MARITIDGNAYEVEAGKNLLETCLSLGLNLPYFCWHHALGSVGACRQCAVKLFKDDKDTSGHLVMACMETVRENMIVSVEDAEARAFRAEIIEWLMINHPHDCAVCDEGGTCHLQDMTVMTGHAYRRFRFRKRTHQNQNLGPFINHEMNRCIQCFRCVRFYRDYAGGHDLDVFAAHDHLYFGREKEGVLENEFSGNLVEVCPTGVFTDKTLKEHYTRKWDLTMAPSICHHCGLGCNTIGGERYGMLRLITNRFNHAVNGYFLCDRGRYGYEFVNSDRRIRQPLIRGGKVKEPGTVTPESWLREFLKTHPTILGIGSPRASLESNFALRRLVGKDRFFQGISQLEAAMMAMIVQAMNSGRFHTPSLKEAEQADVVLILGEDLTNTAPMLALALRQAVLNTPRKKATAVGIPSWHDAAVRELIQQEKGALFSVCTSRTKLDDIALNPIQTTPEQMVLLGKAILHHLDHRNALPRKTDQDLTQRAKEMAAALREAQKPLIITGTSTFEPELISIAVQIAVALSNGEKRADLTFVVPECNSLGLAMTQAPSLQEAIMTLKSAKADAVIILENDLYRRGAKGEINELFDLCDKVVVIDHLANATTERAHLLLPAATFAETRGTLVNNEGRAQTYYQIFAPSNDQVLGSWRWISVLEEMRMNHNSPEYHTMEPDDLIRELSEEMPFFRGATEASPSAQYRVAGQKVPREPHRYSGRTAMSAQVNVSEPKPADDPLSPLSFTMEGYQGIAPSPLNPFFWTPGWNSVQSVNQHQYEVGGSLLGGDAGRRLFPGYPESDPLAPQTMKSAPPAQRDGQWVILPLWHIFGSEELSIHTPGVAERAPQPYIALGLEDINLLNIKDGEVVRVVLSPAEKNKYANDQEEKDFTSTEVEDRTYLLPVVIKEELTKGYAGLPCGLPALSGVQWPARGVIKTMKP